MATLRQLAVNLRRTASELPQRINALAINASMKILDDLITNTPVDTSAALSNWQVSLGVSTSSVISPYFPGIYGSTYNASRSAALEAGLTHIQTKQPGTPLHIVNNIHYIVDLNNGSSSQTPANFVERAILIGSTVIERGLRNDY
jgi:hypothetical protein